MSSERNEESKSVVRPVSTHFKTLGREVADEVVAKYTISMIVQDDRSSTARLGPCNNRNAKCGNGAKASYETCRYI